MLDAPLPRTTRSIVNVFELRNPENSASLVATILSHLLVNSQGFSRLSRPTRKTKSQGELTPDETRFYPRGYVGVEGRTAYHKLTLWTGRAYETAPDMVASDDVDGLLSCWFLKHLPEFETSGNIGNIKHTTLLLTGGTHGLVFRDRFYKQYLKDIKDGVLTMEHFNGRRELSSLGDENSELKLDDTIALCRCGGHPRTRVAQGKVFIECTSCSERSAPYTSFVSAENYWNAMRSRKGL